MKPLINLISRVFLAVALCVSVSAPVVANDDVNRYFWKETPSDTLDRYSTELMEATWNGDAAEVERLLAAGADPRLGANIPEWQGDKKIITPSNFAAIVLVTESDDEERRENFTKIAEMLDKACDSKGYNCHEFRLADSFAKLYLERCVRTDPECRESFAKQVRENAMAGLNKRDEPSDRTAEHICKAHGDVWIAFPGRPGGGVCEVMQDSPDAVSPEPDRAEPKASYDGAIYSAAVIIADGYLPSWVDTQTFAFNQGDKFVTGQSLSVPLDDFTFAAKRVQVNDLTDYEFAVKWEMEF